MKNAGIRTVVLITMLTILYGCPKDPYYMYTHISPDGSCYREFIRNTDSLFVTSLDTAHNPFPMKIDSTWKISFYKRLKDDTSRFKDFPAAKSYGKDHNEFAWFAIATRQYQSVDEMSADFRYNNSEWDTIAPEIELKKKFRWFYTYYHFKESYPPSNPFTKVPISEYLSPLEVATLYGEEKELYKGKNGFEVGTILKDLEDKSDIWLMHNLYEEIFQLYLEHFKSFRNLPVDSAFFASQKDTIYHKYLLKDSYELDDMDEIFNHYYKTSAFNTDEVADFDKLLEERLPGILFSSEIKIDYKLMLPGKVIETNAPFLRNDTLGWKLDDERFFHNCFDIKAESRKANYWAFIVTAIVVLLAMTGFLVKRKPV